MNSPISDDCFQVHLSNFTLKLSKPNPGITGESNALGVSNILRNDFQEDQVSKSDTGCGEKITFWWSVTSSALALARHLESAASEIKDKRIIELGCGPGLVGTAAAMLGARVTFSDYVHDALELAKQNASLNDIDPGNSSYTILDWENPVNVGRFDLVVGSEILYDYYCHSALLKLLDNLVDRSGRIILADRNRLSVSRFLGRLIQRGFQCKELLVKVSEQGLPEQEISLFELTRRD